MYSLLLQSQASFGGGFFRKTQSEKRLLGISDKQMILMDGRTKVRNTSVQSLNHALSVPIQYDITVCAS